ncbi:unnamed protein product [Caretta caretta]
MSEELEQKDIRSVETSQEANTAFRRQIAIVLMKESESVEDYCIYCNLVSCEKKSGGLHNVVTYQTSSVILARGGHLCPAFQKEPITKSSLMRRKNTSAKKVHSSILYQKNDMMCK